MPDLSVNISSGCFSGPYSLFETLRMAWATIALPQNGISPGVLPPEGEWLARLNLTYEAFEPENYLGDWGDNPPDDPIFLILIHAPHMHHPASEGSLNNGYLRPLADRLEGLLDYNQSQLLLLTQQFVNGLRGAAQQGQSVFFS